MATVGMVCWRPPSAQPLGLERLVRVTSSVVALASACMVVMVGAASVADMAAVGSFADAVAVAVEWPVAAVFAMAVPQNQAQLHSRWGCMAEPAVAAVRMVCLCTNPAAAVALVSGCIHCCTDYHSLTAAEQADLASELLLIPSQQLQRPQLNQTLKCDSVQLVFGWYSRTWP
jgi:hypothetical protein